MLKAYFKKKTPEKTTYLKPELYSLGRATFLTHGCSAPGHVEKDPRNGRESYYNSNG